jgi:peptidoglycan hydrolase-like protein with peptidoglycan-binding domain
MAAPAADSEPDPPGWPKAANDQISVIQQALVELKLLSDKPDGVIGPMTRAAIRTFQRSIGARETGEPTRDVFAALQQAMARRNAAASAPPAPATIDLGTPEPPPAPPTSADIARADADAWPASTVDQVTAIQRLLRDLNFSRDPADGIYGPATRAAIVDFERTAGLAQTGEPSKALFESLKDMRSTMRRKSPASP